jgi:hypothetical protein
MTSPRSSTDYPVFDTADLPDDVDSVAGLYDLLEDLSDQQRADRLGVNEWACPFCRNRFETVAGVRRHITRTDDDAHRSEHGTTPSRAIPGYSRYGDPVALIAAGDDDADSRVLPARRDESTGRPALPLTPSTAEAITDAVVSLHPRPAPHRGPSGRLSLDEATDETLHVDDLYTRWICGLCGTYTAATAEELNGHIHATQDDTHDIGGTVDHAGLLMGVDQIVYAVLAYRSGTPQVIAAGSVTQLPDVTLAPHWELKSRYETVAPEQLDVDYWECPYCGAHNEDLSGLRGHISAEEGPHTGQSGPYPDDPIYGYRDGATIAVATPADRDDPNDESVVLAYDVPAVSDPTLALFTDMFAAADNAQAALEELGVLYTLNDQDIAAVLDVAPATVQEYRATHDALPPITRERTQTADRIKDFEIALGTHAAEQLRSGFAIESFLATDATTATRADIDNASPDEVADLLDTDGDATVVETTEDGTVYYRVIPATEGPGGIPPEPELAAVDQEHIATLYSELTELQSLIEADLEDDSQRSGSAKVKLSNLENAREFIVDEFDFDPEDGDTDS